MTLPLYWDRSGQIKLDDSNEKQRHRRNIIGPFRTRRQRDSSKRKYHCGVCLVISAAVILYIYARFAWHLHYIVVDYKHNNNYNNYNNNKFKSNGHTSNSVDLPHLAKLGLSNTIDYARLDVLAVDTQDPQINNKTPEGNLHTTLPLPDFQSIDILSSRLPQTESISVPVVVPEAIHSPKETSHSPAIVFVNDWILTIGHSLVNTRTGQALRYLKASDEGGSDNDNLKVHEGKEERQFYIEKNKKSHGQGHGQEGQGEEAKNDTVLEVVIRVCKETSEDRAMKRDGNVNSNVDANEEEEEEESWLRYLP